MTKNANNIARKLVANNKNYYALMLFHFVAGITSIVFENEFLKTAIIFFMVFLPILYLSVLKLIYEEKSKSLN